MRPTRRSLPIALLAPAALLAAVVASSCFQAESQVCPSGFTCPAGSQCAAAQEICITTRCGNGVRDSDEVCDDGNVRSADGCRADCRSNEECGNGLTDVAKGEVCDDGNQASGDGCSADCKSKEGCGNGRQELDEECDDNNDAGDDNCTPACKFALCGDGYINDAGTPDGGHREYCDDIGESAACNANCTGARCGDFVVNVSAGEDCDRGGINVATCNSNCKNPLCGDGLWNHDAGEQCDDTGESPACNANCTTARCGDFVVNVSAGEDCDRGGINVSTCNSNCKTPACGDGLWNHDAGEQCDTGGQSATCDPDCSLVTCGDLYINVDAGEVCDDSTNGATRCPYGTQTCTVCASNCRTLNPAGGPYCGDGDAGVNRGVDTDAGETCDDGNAVDELSCQYGRAVCHTCNSSCTGWLTLDGGYCGDGNINSADGEICDDSTLDAGSCGYGQVCPNICRSCTQIVDLIGPFCGDGTRNGTESCDDGNSLACGSCSAGCSLNQLGVARGTVTAVRSDDLIDAQGFVLSDGNISLVFEFEDLSGSLPNGTDAGAIAVGFTDSENVTSNVIAERIKSLINTSTLAISANRANGSNVVNLAHQQPGQIGNQLITHTVTASGFAVSGMSGGGGADCPPGTGCATDLDCAPGLTCRPTDGGRTCQP